MVWRWVSLFAVAAAGCQAILGISDTNLATIDAGTPAADAQSPAADAPSPLADARGGAVSLELTPLTLDVAEHEHFVVRVVARDASGQPAVAYDGPVTMTSDWGDVTVIQ